MMNTLNRLYNFFGDYLWSKYKTRVLKLPINAGLSCPNRDGTLGSDGCIFCSEDGSASPTSSGSKDILTQMEEAKNNFRRSDMKTKYIAYFQAYTNTNSPITNLKKIYDAAVNFHDVIGLMIGTRPDSIPDEILDLISSYNKAGFELWIEIRLQSMHDKSLDVLKRKHDHKTTRDAIKRASGKNLPVCVHVILGIPGETWEDMMATALEISSLPVNGVKIHHLHVIKGTILEKLYSRGDFSILTMKEYASITCDFIERLRPDILIHRLLGDRNEDSLIAPRWGLHKGTVIKAIENEFLKRCSCQGLLFNQGVNLSH